MPQHVSLPQLRPGGGGGGYMHLFRRFGQEPMAKEKDDTSSMCVGFSVCVGCSLAACCTHCITFRLCCVWQCGSFGGGGSHRASWCKVLLEFVAERKSTCAPSVSAGSFSVPGSFRTVDRCYCCINVAVLALVRCRLGCNCP